MTHEEIEEEMKNEARRQVADTETVDVDSLITTTVNRVREEIRKSFDEWFKNGTEDVEDWAERTLSTLNK